uniref:Uncharacterized protein n=1 Tax=Aegilops tauschii subsp. strangulata TaxID=200361 RepID=A0A452XVU8_AEGTS
MPRLAGPTCGTVPRASVWDDDLILKVMRKEKKGPGEYNKLRPGRTLPCMAFCLKLAQEASQENRLPKPLPDPLKKPSSSYQSNAHARKPLPATINYTSGHITKQCGRLKK